MHGPWQRLMWYRRQGRWSARLPSRDVDRAGPEREQAADQVHRLVDRRGRRVRPEVAAAVVDELAGPLDPREVVGQGDLDVRVALVVLEPDVEAGLVALDQVRFEQERFRHGVGQGRLDVGDPVDDAPDPVRLTVRRSASASSCGPGCAGSGPCRRRARRPGVLHQVHAGPVGQLAQGGFELGGHASIVPRSMRSGAWATGLGSGCGRVARPFRRARPSVGGARPSAALLTYPIVTDAGFGPWMTVGVQAKRDRVPHFVREAPGLGAMGQGPGPNSTDRPAC